MINLYKLSKNINTWSKFYSKIQIKENFDLFLKNKIELKKDNNKIDKKNTYSIRKKYRNLFEKNINKENINEHFNFIEKYFRKKDELINVILSKDNLLEKLNYKELEYILINNLYLLKFKAIQKIILNININEIENISGYIFFLNKILIDNISWIPNLNQIFFKLLNSNENINTNDLISLLDILKKIDKFELTYMILNHIFQTNNYSKILINKIFDFYYTIENNNNFWINKFIFWLSEELDFLEIEICIKSIKFINEFIFKPNKKINNYMDYILKNKELECKHILEILINFDINNKFLNNFKSIKEIIITLFDKIHLESTENLFLFLNFISNFRYKKFLEKNINGINQKIENILLEIYEKNNEIFSKEYEYIKENNYDLINLNNCIFYNKIRYLFVINNIEMNKKYDKCILKFLEYNIGNINYSDIIILLLNNNYNKEYNEDFYKKIKIKFESINIYKDLEFILSIIKLFDKDNNFENLVRLKEIWEDVIIEKIDKYRQNIKYNSINKIYKIDVNSMLLINDFYIYSKNINIFEEKFIDIISKLLIFSSNYNFGSLDLYDNLTNSFIIYLEDLFKTKEGIDQFLKILPFINNKYYSNNNLMESLNNIIKKNIDFFLDLNNYVIINYFNYLVSFKICCDYNWLKFENNFKNREVNLYFVLYINKLFLKRKKFTNSNLDYYLNLLKDYKFEKNNLTDLVFIIEKLINIDYQNKNLISYLIKISKELWINKNNEEIMLKLDEFSKLIS